MVLVFLFLPAAYTYTRWQSVVSKNAAAVGGINVWGVLFRNNGIEPGNCTMVASTRAFVRLASRSELFGCSVVFSLLFLPVAGYRIGLSHDASQGRYWSSVTASNNGESMRALAAYFTKAQFNTGAIFPRHSLLAIRLASRSELFGCSVVFGLLFLPAAGQMIDGKSQVLNQWVRVWTNLASEASGMQLRSVLISCKGSNIPGALTGGREEGRSIRLASRSELFGCSDVVGVCLLFLPAEYPWCYWSVSSRADAREYVCEAVRIQWEYWSSAFGMWRSGRFAIRLASRSELFGCSFDGVGCSVPARCGPNE